MGEIKTKSFQYGHEHEADWPPRFPEHQEGFVGYWDRDTQSFKEGYPPRQEVFDTAPIAILHNMEPQYHQGLGRKIDNIKDWDRADKETGNLTFTSSDEPRKYIEKGKQEERRKIKEDRRKANLAAMQAQRANPREVRQKLQKEGEKQIESLKKSGLDQQLKKQGINYE